MGYAKVFRSYVKVFISKNKKYENPIYLSVTIDKEDQLISLRLENHDVRIDMTREDAKAIAKILNEAALEAELLQ